MASASARKYETYHCVCNQLILATTQPLENYRQRGGDALDKAYIVPLTELPSTSDSDGDMAVPVTVTSDALPAGNDEALPSRGTKAKQFAVLHVPSIVKTSSKKPLIVMRADGFEPRYQVKCVRCSLIFGYHTEKSHYSHKAQGHGDSQEGPREDVLFVLPDSLKRLE